MHFFLHLPKRVIRWGFMNHLIRNNEIKTVLSLSGDSTLAVGELHLLRARKDEDPLDYGLQRLACTLGLLKLFTDPCLLGNELCNQTKLLKSLQIISFEKMHYHFFLLIYFSFQMQIL